MKLTLVGGGGVRAPLFIESALRRAEWSNLTELCLFDIDGPRLELFGGLGAEIARRMSSPVKITTSLDPERALDGAAYVVTTVRPGLEEGRFLTGASTPEGIAAFYRERGAKLVVVKLGPAGAWFDGEHGCGTVPGFPVAEVVDTVGAGDGFAVGVVSALLEGRSVPDAVRRGCWIGARAVQVLGDTEGLPTRAQLQEAGL